GGATAAPPRHPPPATGRDDSLTRSKPEPPNAPSAAESTSGGATAAPPRHPPPATGRDDSLTRSEPEPPTPPSATEPAPPPPAARARDRAGRGALGLPSRRSGVRGPDRGD